jgi:hypothetical protein
MVEVLGCFVQVLSIEFDESETEIDSVCAESKRWIAQIALAPLVDAPEQPDSSLAGCGKMLVHA